MLALSEHCWYPCWKRIGLKCLARMLHVPTQGHFMSSGLRCSWQNSPSGKHGLGKWPICRWFTVYTYVWQTVVFRFSYGKWWFSVATCLDYRRVLAIPAGSLDFEALHCLPLAPATHRTPANAVRPWWKPSTKHFLCEDVCRLAVNTVDGKNPAPVANYWNSYETL